jgi:hypothetical protein
MDRARPDLRPFTALVMRAEIGGAGRFGSARKLAFWAGLTGRLRQQPSTPSWQTHPRGDVLCTSTEAHPPPQIAFRSAMP